MDEDRPSPRYELIDGELLVTPSPRPLHQWLVWRLGRLLDEYVERHRAGHVLASPADLELEANSIVQPDLFVLPAGCERPVESWDVVKRLILAVEVLSPTSLRHDRVTKRRFFQRVKVPEYWVVDPDTRLVERWTPDDDRPEVLDDRLTWWPVGEAAALEIDVTALFRTAWGE
jgi:Uma2 family endonuclease